MSLSCLRYSEISVKNRRFEPTSPLFGATVRRDPVGILPRFWRQKTKVTELSYGVVYVILRLAVLVQCRLVADGRTDIRCHHVPR